MAAWIHPETNGDYKLVGISTGTTTGDSEKDVGSSFDDVVQASVGTDLNAVAPSVSWQTLGSFDYGVEEATSHLGTFSYAIYNTNGEKISNDSAGMWGSSLLGKVDHLIASPYASLVTGAGQAEIWTGSESDGTVDSGDGLGYTKPAEKFSTNVGDPFYTSGSWFSSSSYDQYDATSTFLRAYGFSPTISTISGSISGTITRVNSEIWAVGSISVTADVDFGGVVNLKGALDASQAPTVTGVGTIDVGVGGTVVGVRHPVANKGTNNQVGSSAGGIKIKYGV